MQKTYNHLAKIIDIFLDNFKYMMISKINKKYHFNMKSTFKKYIASQYQIYNY
jgi:hypothetical protein